MTTHDWHSRWRTEGRVEVSEDGWLLHPLGGMYELFRRLPFGPPISRGTFVSAVEARLEADRRRFLGLQARLGTGAADHEVRGGYDVTVARFLAADLPCEVVTTSRRVEPEDDDAPYVIVIHEQMVMPGRVRYLPSLVEGSRVAARQRQETGQVQGRVLSYDLSEIARVPSLEELDPEARASYRRMLRITFEAGLAQARAG